MLSRGVRSYVAARFVASQPARLMSNATVDFDEYQARLKVLELKNVGKLSPREKDYVEEHGSSPYTGLGPAQVQYNIFNEDPQFTVQKRLVGPFGTIDKPTKVFSPKPYRIVGCTGSHEEPHAIGWFVMEGYLKHMCPECGQMFQLTNNADEVCTDYIDKVDPNKHFLA